MSITPARVHVLNYVHSHSNLQSTTTIIITAWTLALPTEKEKLDVDDSDSELIPPFLPQTETKEQKEDERQGKESSGNQIPMQKKNNQISSSTLLYSTVLSLLETRLASFYFK